MSIPANPDTHSGSFRTPIPEFSDTCCVGGRVAADDEFEVALEFTSFVVVGRLKTGFVSYL